MLLGDLPPGWQGPFLVGMIAAAGSGLLAIWGLLGYVRRHNYTLFVVYRLILAAFILLLIATNVRQRWRDLHRERRAGSSRWLSGHCCS